MKNFKKLIAMMLMLASVFFIACSEDDEVEKMSPDEAQAMLNEMEVLHTDMSFNLTIWLKAEGLNAMEILSEIPRSIC